MKEKQTVKKEPIPETAKCPRCECSRLGRGGKTSLGKPMLICKECKYRFVMVEYRDREAVQGVTCDKCESSNIARAGLRKDGRQMYHCKDCLRTFVTERLISNYR